MFLVLSLNLTFQEAYYVRIVLLVFINDVVTIVTKSKNNHISWESIENKTSVELQLFVIVCSISVYLKKR